MNLTLSKRGDYVLKSAVCLARAYPSSQACKIREVAAEMGVPRTFAPQILADLVKANLATSKSGRDGGYRLSRSPESITLLEVLEAGEGSIGVGDTIPRSLQGVWARATEALRESLATTTLEEVAGDLSTLSASTTPVVSTNGHHSRARSVSVRSSAHLDVPAHVVALHLASGAWLESLTSNGTDPGSTAEKLIRVGPGSARILSKTVTLSVAEPRAVDDGLELAISWVATGAAALFPRLSAILSVRPGEDGGSTLELCGTYTPPLKSAGAKIDAAVFRGIAVSTVESFLKRVVRSLELITTDR